VRRRRAILVAVLAACLLDACGSLLIRNETTREYVSLQNASVVLHRDVVVPPERARVLFQDGVVQPKIKDVLLVAKKLTMKLRNPIDQQKIQC